MYRLVIRIYGFIYITDWYLFLFPSFSDSPTYATDLPINIVEYINSFYTEKALSR